MKSGYAAGHNTPYNNGASALGRTENALTRELTNKILELSKLIGEEAFDCTPPTADSLTNSLARRCATADANKVDFFADIHFNITPGGTGTETFYYKPEAKAYAQRVAAELSSALGLKNRGAKYHSGFYVLKHTKSPSLIIEVCFMDNASDMAKYNVDKAARAIIKAVTGKTVPDNVTAKPSTPTTSAQPSNEVAVIQNNLNKLGIKDYDGKTLAVDGIMGERTKYAIQKLQTICGVEADGTINSKLKTIIATILMKPLCKVGSTGYAVRYIQWRVGAGVDGIFGQNTKNKVMAWQRTICLSADGIVGNATWSRLID